MTDWPPERALAYRERAAEIRSKAEGLTDDKRRKEMTEVADTWNWMADWEEKIHIVRPTDPLRRA